MNLKKLLILSYCYLIVPNLLFLYFWFDFEYVILPIFFQLVIIFILWPKLNNTILNEKIEIKNLVYIFVIAVFYVLLSGTGDFFPQIYDFWGHNAKLNNLRYSNWPVTIPKKNTYFAYYFGYYIVPSSLSYLTGISLKLMNFLFIVTGLFIAFFLLFIYFKKNIKLLLLATLISTPSISLLNILTFGYYSKYVFLENKFWLHDFFKALQWEPHQLVPSIICASLVLTEFNYSRKLVYSLLLIPIVLIWSPFLSISLSLTILLYYLWIFFFKKDFSILKNFKFIISFFILCISVIPIAFYLISNESSSLLAFMPPTKSLSWNTSFVVFISTNILIFYFFIFGKYTTVNSKVFASSLFLIIILSSTIRTGVHNDFLIKTTIFPILIIHFRFAEELYRRFLSSRNYHLIGIVFLISFSGTFSNLLNQLHFLKLEEKALIYKLNKPKKFESYKSIDKMLLEKYSQKEALQYRGDVTSIYAKILAKKTLGEKINSVNKSPH